MTVKGLKDIRMTNNSCFIYVHIYQYYFILCYTCLFFSYYISTLLITSDLLLPICQPYTESNAIGSDIHYYIPKAL